MVWIVVNCCKLQWHIPLLIVCRLTSCLTVTFIFCSLFPCLAVVWRHWRAFCDYVVQLTTRRLLASFWGSVTRIIAALRFVIVMVSLSLGSTLALLVVLEMVINGNWTFCWQTSSVTFCWKTVCWQDDSLTFGWQLARWCTFWRCYDLSSCLQIVLSVNFVVSELVVGKLVC